MEIGILDIKGALPCFENFGNLPTKIIDENNVKIINDLDMLIMPGGSLVESGSLTDDLKKQIIEFDNIILGICSGFQILCEKIDIGRKSPVPIVKEGLNLLGVEFSPLICTDRVKFNIVESEIFENNSGTGFHCHTYGDIKITNKKTKPLTYSSIQKLNYKMTGGKDILSGVYCNNIIGTMVHNFLDNKNIRENLFNYLKIDEIEQNNIFKKNKEIKNKLKAKSIIYNNKYKNENNNNKNTNDNKNLNSKKGLILLATGSDSGKTFLITSIVSKLNKKTFVAKIGPDVRDIVPSLYILREEMTKYNSIKIADRGWCEVEEFMNFVNNSDYEYYIIEGVMGAFTGALNKKNYSGAEISKTLGAPTYIVSACNKSGIEGAFVESLAYYSLLKEMGVNVKGMILNKIYNFEIFEKVKEIGENIGLEVIGVGKAIQNKRGLMPEVEIDYEEFCKNANNITMDINIPKLNINGHNNSNNSNTQNYDFKHYLEKWSKKI
ncbi:AAA family ATPase [Methanococcus aeolicus]|nr:AAA family ATPase [Methanococcus aeolicus]UXM84722.1 AAA family ATPase [Methanococcus aeolicus]